MPKLSLSYDQRFLLDAVFSNHRGSLQDTRALHKIADRIGIEDLFKNQIISDRMILGLIPSDRSLISNKLGVTDFEFTSVEGDKIANALRAWENYGVADVEPIELILTALEKLPPKLRSSKR